MPSPSPCVKLVPQIVKHQPTLETIDEGTSNSVGNADEDMIIRKSSIGGVDSSGAAVRALPLSLKEAIALRRKSGPLSDPSAVITATYVKSPAVNVTKKLPTPIRAQIQSRLIQNLESKFADSQQPASTTATGHTTNSSERELQKKKMHTPLKNAIQRLCKNYDADSMNEQISKSKIRTKSPATKLPSQDLPGARKALSAPLMKAIQARLKCEEGVEKSLPRTPARSLATPMESNKPSALPVALRDAINARRRKSMTPATAMRTPAKAKTPVMYPQRRALPTPLRQAIQATKLHITFSDVPSAPPSTRKAAEASENKSANEVEQMICDEAVDSEENGELAQVDAAAEAVLDEAQPETILLSQGAIEQVSKKRRLSRVDAGSPDEGDFKPVVKRSKLEDRRRSLRQSLGVASNIDTAVNLFHEDCLLAAAVQIGTLAVVGHVPEASLEAEDLSADIVERSVASILSPSLKTNISAMLDEDEDMEEESDGAMDAGDENSECEERVVKEEDSCESVEEVMDLVNDCEKTPRCSLMSVSVVGQKTPATTPAILKATVSAKKTAIASTTPAPISNSSAAKTPVNKAPMHMNKTPATNTASAKTPAQKSVSDQLRAPPTTSHRTPVLRSLQKRGRARGLDSLSRGPMPDDMCEELSEEDMAVIAHYAELLPFEEGAEAEERFAVALDAFVRGIECAQSIAEEVRQEAEKEISVPSAISEAAKEVAECNDVEAVEKEEVRETSTEDVKEVIVVLEGPSNNDIVTKSISHDFVSATTSAGTADFSTAPHFTSLAQLFRLPHYFLDTSCDDLDAELVERYASEILAASDVDEAVAFGVALDSFLSDPVEFRRRVGLLSHPQAQRVHYLDTKETAEEEEDDEEREIEPAVEADEESVEDFVDAGKEDEEVATQEEIEDEKQIEEDIVAEEASFVEVHIRFRHDESLNNVSRVSIESSSSAAGASRIETEEGVVETLLSEDREVDEIADVVTDTSSTAEMSTDAVSEPSDHVAEVAEEIVSSREASSMESETIHMDVIDTEEPQLSSVEATREEEKESLAEVVSNEASEEVMEEVSSAKRSARKSISSPAPSQTVEEDMVVVEEVPAKKGRGRKPAAKTVSKAKKTVEGDESIESAVTTHEETPCESLKSKRGRGRSAQQMQRSEEVQEKPLEEVVEEVAVPAAKRRRASIAATISQSTSVPTVPAKKRGTKVAAPVIIEEVEETEEEEFEEVTVILCDKYDSLLRYFDISSSNVLMLAVCFLSNRSRCDGEFALDDIGLKSVPEGDWFCEKCTKKAAAKKKPATSTEVKRNTRARK